MQVREIKKVLVIGRGEVSEDKNKLACEEIQTCLAILEEDCQAVLITNAGSHPMMEATLDIPIYQLPLTSSFIDEIIEKEEPDAVFAPFVESAGWQLTKRLFREGYWEEKSIKVIDNSPLKGQSVDALKNVRKAIAAANLRQCQRFEISSPEEALEIPSTLGGFPIALRSADKGVKIVKNPDNFRSQVSIYLEESSEGTIFIEECLSGWKEVEVGILRDAQGKVKDIFTAENVIPIGIHSADTMSVSPIQTLTESRQQFIIAAALQLAKKLDSFVGYGAIRFAIEPGTDKVLVYGIDFSISRSADVSLMLGHPLVKIVTKLTIGCSLDDLSLYDSTSYRGEKGERLLLKMPQFDLISIDNGKNRPGENAKSVSDKIYAGRNFYEAFRKAWYEKNMRYSQLENGQTNLAELQEYSFPYWDQMHHIYRAFAVGTSVSEVESLTKIDSWFLQKIKRIVEAEKDLRHQKLSAITKQQWSSLKQFGFSDDHIANELNSNGKQITASSVRSHRESLGIYPSLLRFGSFRNGIDKQNKKIMVLTSVSGSKEDSLIQIPAFVLAKEAKQMGFDVVLVNSNTHVVPFWMMYADYLYIEPLDWEIIFEIYRKEDPSGIFIEADNAVPVDLEKRFSKVGAPIVKVPFELTGKMLKRDSA